ncbi:ABC transporter substrate-binding protein [Streptomyces sp. NPDC060194]|uniref:ABC transporter substrate-binding protein n=1 Tax=Streptomyces sp. NPDC060194 TaxID=3347069 RepID=UPI003650142E
MLNPPQPSRADESAPIRLGALAPLTPPGWADAGRHLLAGLDLGVREANAAGGIHGRPLELVVRDTAADPQRATAAMEEFDALGAVAVVGEYHSVVARAAASRADALGLPFLCSSAVLDALTDRPTDWVARIAPAQSHGWRVYAGHVLDAGHRRIAVATQPSVYWASGTRILRDHLASRGGTVVELDTTARTPAALCDALADLGVTALLLLVGHPEPATTLVRAVRSDPRLTDVLIGAPAGQPELPSWSAMLAGSGAAVPFLRYLPADPGPLGSRVSDDLRGLLGEPPSFVALEGWDSIAVLSAMLRHHGTRRADLAASWSRTSVDGSRGPIRFSRAAGTTTWQWAWPPVHVADRDPAAPDRFRTLSAGGHP